MLMMLIIFSKILILYRSCFSYSQTLKSSHHLKVKIGTCEEYWIGASKFNTDKPLGCRWVSFTNVSIRVLGNFISYNDLITHQLDQLITSQTTCCLISPGL